MIRRDPIQWMARTLSGNDYQADGSIVQGALQDWRYAQTNDAEVLGHEADRSAVAEACQLIPTEPTAALERLLALANAGSVWSMLVVGWIYERGSGRVPDQSKAEKWYRLACNHGSQQAQLRLGQMYYKRRELEKSEQVFRVGVIDRWPPAIYYLALIRLVQPRTAERLREARVLLQEAAALGDLGAQIDLCRLLVTNTYGYRGLLVGLRLCFPLAFKIIALVDKRTQRDGASPAASF